MMVTHGIFKQDVNSISKVRLRSLVKRIFWYRLSPSTHKVDSELIYSGLSAE